MATPMDRQFFVTGRVLLALMFLVSGLAKLASTHVLTSGYVGSDGFPLSSAHAFAWGAVETLTALLLALGYQVSVTATALAAFVLLTNLVFHRFWAFEPEFQFAQQVLFMKNLALIGGLITIAASAHARVAAEA